VLKYIVAGLSITLVAWAAYSLLRKRTPEEKLTALAKEVGAKGEIFKAELQGKPAAFLLMNCEVFALDASGSKVKRTKVLKTGFYLGFTTCLGQSNRMEGDYLVVTLENRAIGAGGGNTSGGVYRSLDGWQWQKKVGEGWLPVADAQA
jgi:hypothetical protein